MTADKLMKLSNIIVSFNSLNRYRSGHCWNSPTVGLLFHHFFSFPMSLSLIMVAMQGRIQLQMYYLYISFIPAVVKRERERIQPHISGNGASYNMNLLIKSHIKNYNMAVV